MFLLNVIKASKGSKAIALIFLFFCLRFLLSILSLKVKRMSNINFDELAATLLSNCCFMINDERRFGAVLRASPLVVAKICHLVHFVSVRRL